MAVYSKVGGPQVFRELRGFNEFTVLIQQTQKPLSFGERKLLDRARHMLTAEFSTSRHLGETEAAEMLDHALAKAQLHLPERR